MIPRLCAGAALATLMLALPAVAAAQEPVDEAERRTFRPALGAHLGYAAVERADDTFEVGAWIDVGSYRFSRLRVAIGVDYLKTEPARGQGQGSYSDVSVSGDLRLKPFRIRSVVPYVGAGVGIHFRSNDIPVPNVADIYDGIAVGVQGVAGLMVDGAASGRWGVSGELRAVRAQNLNRTSLRGGVFVRL
jgi:hypothetical protein